MTTTHEKLTAAYLAAVEKTDAALLDLDDEHDPAAVSAQAAENAAWTALDAEEVRLLELGESLRQSVPEIAALWEKRSLRSAMCEILARWEARPEGLK